MEKVRVRYAPSPTGHLHIGGARTALFNYLFAKHYDGDFIFRLEDTDIERNIEGGEASQLDNLAWLGIVPDESPLNPNPKYAPYRQMERLDIYRKYANELLQRGLAYKCFCTPEELDAEHERQVAAGKAPMYNDPVPDQRQQSVDSDRQSKLLFPEQSHMHQYIHPESEDWTVLHNGHKSTSFPYPHTTNPLP